MSVIDIHTHAFPSNLARRAIAALEAGCPWKAVADGTVDALIESMNAVDIDVSVVCAVATKCKQVANIFKWCKKIRSDRIEPFCSVHPETPKADRWIAKFAEAGFIGVKLHPMYQDFAIDEPRMNPIYAAARECGLIVALHCGFDIAFPDDDRASCQRVRRVIDRFARLRLLCTHMGGWQMWDEAERHILGADVYLETSFSLDDLGRDRAVKMIERHGSDRVMMGSDWPWRRQDEAIRLIEQLGLSEKQTRDILWANAAKLLGY